MHQGWLPGGFPFGMGMAPPPMMNMGMGMPLPFGPFGGIGFGLGGIQSAGPLAEPRNPWNTPGLMGNPSTTRGACVPGAPSVGFAPADMPPPPLGIDPTIVPPFMPGELTWAGAGISPAVVAPGHGFGLGGMGMGLSVGMGMGMGMPGMGMGFGGLGGLGLWPGMQQPAPAMITEASGNVQPVQEDPTTVAGGVPPGATHIESAEHAIIHLLKAPAGLDPTYPFYPWLNHGNPMEVEILHVGCSTGLNRMIQVCMPMGQTDCNGWAITECHEMVSGIWEKGQTFVYDDAVSKVLTIGDAGWNNQRNRPGGQSLHIYLHRA